jgi:DNA-binding MarR family transcriptional regulator
MAFADALDEGARVLMRLSARLRALHASEPASPPVPSPAGPELPRARSLGPRQLAVLALGGLSDRLGLSAADVAKALGYTTPNATNLLKRLEELDLLVRIAGERPARWRRRAPGDV